MPFYAVRNGRSPGVYLTWEECNEQVFRFPNAVFKTFKSEQEAVNFISDDSNDPNSLEILETEMRIHVNRKNQETGRIKEDGTFETLGIKEEEEEILDFENKEICFGSIIHKFQSKTKSHLPTCPVVYTAGCCFMDIVDGRSELVSGVGVYWAPLHPKNVSKYFNVEQPNQNKADLIAASHAIESAFEMKIKNLELRTNSKFIINLIKEYIPKWEKNKWEYIGDINMCGNEIGRLFQLCKEVTVTWVYVSLRDGIYGMDEADNLAREGASSHKV